jgi:hypothetical protein
VLGGSSNGGHLGLTCVQEKYYLATIMQNYFENTVVDIITDTK